MGTAWFYFVTISFNVALVQIIAIKTSLSIPIRITIFFVFLKAIFAHMWGNFWTPALPAATPASAVYPSYLLCAQVAQVCWVALSDLVIRCPCVLGRILPKA